MEQPHAAVSLAGALARIDDLWSPHRVATVNDYDVKVVKVQGEFTWHRHHDTDELFLVLDGELTVLRRDGDVVVRPGEVYVVPRGVEHCPRASELTTILLLEPAGVVNTGDAGGPQTVQLRDLP
jgi:mannose-6-phosphate isomerase-like protein (cupin superfamily)